MVLDMRKWDKPPGGSLGRQSVPAIFARYMQVQSEGNNLHGSVTVPRLILHWWRPIPGERLDIGTARSAAWGVDYAYMRPATDAGRGMPGTRYKLSRGGSGTRTVSLPKHFLWDMKSSGEPIRAGIIQLGLVAVMVSVDQLKESARRASEAADDQAEMAPGALAARIGAIASDVARAHMGNAHTVTPRLGQALDNGAFREGLPDAARFIRRRAA